MKSLLWLIPVLLLIAALWFFRSTEGGETSTRPSGTRGARDSSPSLAGDPNPPAGVHVAPHPPRGAGGLHIRVRSAGRGLAGARVEMREENGPGEKIFQTDPDGEQTVRQVPVASYDVTVRVNRHIPQNFHVDIRADQTTELLVDLKPGGRITGTVTDPSGRPLPGTFVRLGDPTSKGFVLPDLATRTDEAGQYVMDGVPLEEYVLHFRHLEFKPETTQGIRLRDAQDLLRVDAVLHRGATVSGRVLDPDGRPVAGARVLAFAGFSSSATTDASGDFGIFGMLEQDVALSVSARGFGTHSVWGVRQNTTGLEIRLVPAGSVQGRLEADPPTEVSRILLTRYEVALGREIQSQPQPIHKEDGSFVIPDLEPGSYRIEADSPGYEALDRPTITVVAGHETGGLVLRLRKLK